jgi:ComF family protein
LAAQGTITREGVFSSNVDLTRSTLLAQAVPSIAPAGHSEPYLSSPKGFFVATAAAVMNTVFPADCRLCAAPLTTISRLPVCADCLASVVSFDGTACEVCGENIPSPIVRDADVAPRCWLCTRVQMPFAKAEAFGAYDGALRGLIHLLKYEDVLPAADALGRTLVPVIASLLRQTDTQKIVVVPVPLHRRRQRSRGFNQSERIAHAALTRMREPRLHLNSKLLLRKRATVTQTGLTRHQRRANLRGAFAVTDRTRLKDQVVLLVDDVMTTGTTAYECARVLQRAGAKQVLVATVARVYRDATPLAATFSERPQAGTKAGGARPGIGEA